MWHCGAGQLLTPPEVGHHVSYAASLHQGLTVQSGLRTQASARPDAVVNIDTAVVVLVFSAVARAEVDDSSS